MTELSALALIVVGFISGMWAGVELRDLGWRENAGEPRRVLRKGQFYKVVELSNPRSWDMLKIHEDENPGYDGGMTVPDDWIKIIEDNCWDLRCTSEPTGGDDYDVIWHVIEHYMAEPHERTLASDLCPVKALGRATSNPDPQPFRQGGRE